MPLLSFQAFNATNVFMRHQNFFGFVTPILSEQDKQDSTFFVSDETWHIGGVVQIHAAIPTLLDFVLRQSEFNFVLQKFSEQSGDDASFTVVGGLVNPNVGLTIVSFQSVSVPDRFIMQRDSHLVLETPDNFQTQEAATWFVTAPNTTTFG
jgi:Alpha-L-arabinofuranosidase B (ABFB) domain